MFIGRTKELRRLRQLTKKQVASLVVMTGRRRIGKSRLLQEFGKDFPRSYFFTGLSPAPGITAQDQRDEFAHKLAQHFSWPSFQRQHWSELFSLLAQETQAGPVCLVFDEISWMAEGSPLFLAQLKNAWDLEFKNNPKLLLVLCGSISSWIHKNILSSTGFVGRISEVIKLEELSLQESVQFWGPQGFRLSHMEKIKFLNVVGGIPRYLEELDPSKPAEQNIQRLAFQEGGFLFNEFDRLFSDLFQSRHKNYKSILKALVSGPKSLQEISLTLRRESGGSLTEALQDLEEAGFVRGHTRWNFSTGAFGKIKKYSIVDNYSRFYLKYISPNREKILKNLYPDKDLQFLSGWESIMGLQFENLVIKNARSIFEILHIDKRDIINAGPYFQTKTKTQHSCQIDYLIQTRFQTLYLCEIKFRLTEGEHSVIQEVERKRNTLLIPKNFSTRPILISAGPVHPKVSGERYFDEIIHIEDFLHPKGATDR